MKRPSKSYEIALSAISCAVATIFLTVGSLNPFLLATGYLVGCFALMIPLSKGFLLGDVLAYLAAGVLALIFGGGAYFWKLLPYFVFFGLHPLANYLQARYRWNGFLCFLVKAAWFDGAMYLCWRFAFDMSAAAQWINDYILLVIFVGGTLFFAVYDRMIFLCQKSVDEVIKRIGR